MNRETVIQLAREAGFSIGDGQIYAESEVSFAHARCTKAIERFAAAIEQRTLERGAAVCDELEDKAEESRAFRAYADAQKECDMDYEISRGKHWMTVNMYNTAVKKCADAIRALGEKT